MKTRLQRQRTATATPEQSGSDRANLGNDTTVQAQTSGETTLPLEVQLQRAADRGHSLGGITIQPALVIGEPGDKYEQEADELASQAVQAKPDESATVSQKSGEEDGPVVQRQGDRQPSRLPAATSTDTVQQQPDLDLGGAVSDLGGGDLGGIGDISSGGGLGGGDLTHAASDLGGGDPGGMLGGGGLGEMESAIGGGDALGGMAAAIGGDDGLGGMAEAMGGGDEGAAALGAIAATGALADTSPDMAEGMNPEAPAEDWPEPTMLPGGSTLEETGTGDGATELEASVVAAMGSGGQSLPEETQQLMRQKLGMADPEEIVIHTDGQAASLCESMGALAFTTGRHIFFAEGEYDPYSPEGQELLFHEAVHTMQQGATEPEGEAGETAVAETTKEPVADPTGNAITEGEATGRTEANAGVNEGDVAATGIATETPAGVDVDAPMQDAVSTGLNSVGTSDTAVTEADISTTEAAEDSEAAEQTEEEKQAAAEEKQKETEKQGEEDSENAKSEGAAETSGAAAEQGEKLDTGGPAEKGKKAPGVPKISDYTGGIDEISYDEFDPLEADEPDYEPGEVELPTWDEVASGTVQMDMATASQEINWRAADSPEEETTEDTVPEDNDEVFSTGDRGEMIGDAIGSGLLQGITQGATNFAQDFLMEQALSALPIPYADGLISLMTLAQDPAAPFTAIGDGAKSMVAGFAAIGDEDNTFGVIAASLEAIIGIIDFINSIVGLINTIFQITMFVCYVLWGINFLIGKILASNPFTAAAAPVFETIAAFFMWWVRFIDPINNIVSNVGNFLTTIKLILLPIAMLFRIMDILESDADPETMMAKQAKLQGHVSGFTQSMTERGLDATKDATADTINKKTDEDGNVLSFKDNLKDQAATRLAPVAKKKNRETGEMEWTGSLVAPVKSTKDEVDSFKQNKDDFSLTKRGQLDADTKDDLNTKVRNKPSDAESESIREGGDIHTKIKNKPNDQETSLARDGGELDTKIQRHPDEVETDLMKPGGDLDSRIDQRPDDSELASLQPGGALDTKIKNRPSDDDIDNAKGAADNAQQQYEQSITDPNQSLEDVKAKKIAANAAEKKVKELEKRQQEGDEAKADKEDILLRQQDADEAQQLKNELTSRQKSADEAQRWKDDINTRQGDADAAEVERADIKRRQKESDDAEDRMKYDFSDVSSYSDFKKKLKLQGALGQHHGMGVTGNAAGFLLSFEELEFLKPDEIYKAIAEVTGDSITTDDHQQWLEDYGADDDFQVLTIHLSGFPDNAEIDHPSNDLESLSIGQLTQADATEGQDITGSHAIEGTNGMEYQVMVPNGEYSFDAADLPYKKTVQGNAKLIPDFKSNTLSKGTASAPAGETEIDVDGEKDNPSINISYAVESNETASYSDTIYGAIATPKDAVVSADGETVLLTFTEALADTDTAAEAFSIGIVGAPYSTAKAAHPEAVDIAGDTVTLSNPSTSFASYNDDAAMIGADQEVNVQYTNSNDAPLRDEDESSNLVRSFSQVADNGSEQDLTQPKITREDCYVPAAGDRIVLPFSETLDSDVMPDTTDFIVTINDESCSVDDIEIDGKQVIVTPEITIAASDAVVLMYHSSDGNHIQDQFGNHAEGTGLMSIPNHSTQSATDSGEPSAADVPAAAKLQMAADGGGAPAAPVVEESEPEGVSDDMDAEPDNAIADFEMDDFDRSDADLADRDADDDHITADADTEALGDVDFDEDADFTSGLADIDMLSSMMSPFTQDEDALAADDTTDDFADYEDEEDGTDAFDESDAVWDEDMSEVESDDMGDMDPDDAMDQIMEQLPEPPEEASEVITGSALAYGEVDAVEYDLWYKQEAIEQQKEKSEAQRMDMTASRGVVAANQDALAMHQQEIDTTQAAQEEQKNLSSQAESQSKEGDSQSSAADSIFSAILAPVMSIFSFAGSQGGDTGFADPSSAGQQTNEQSQGIGKVAQGNEETTKLSDQRIKESEGARKNADAADAELTDVDSTLAGKEEDALESSALIDDARSENEETIDETHDEKDELASNHEDAYEEVGDWGDEHQEMRLELYEQYFGLSEDEDEA